VRKDLEKPENLDFQINTINKRGKLQVQHKITKQKSN